MNNCPQCIRSAKEAGEDNQYLTDTGEICTHGIARKNCAEHGGSHLCTSCKLTMTRKKNTECSPCHRFRNGDAPLKQREASLKKYLDTAVTDGVIPAYTSHDKAIALGLDPILYGNSRPDWVWILPDRWIVLECDEQQHAGVQYSCERRRELQICNVAAGIPVNFIRFNPDTFKTGSKSSRVKLSSDTIEKRHSVVVASVKSAVKHKTPKGLTFTKLFFDCTCVGNGAVHECNFIHTNHYTDHEAFLMAFQ
jgi:hypothetical protein